MLRVTVRRYRCTGCGHVWRQDTSKAAEPRSKLSRGALAWVLMALVARPPTQVIVDFIDDHKDQHGVEPIYRTLQETNAAIAPSTTTRPRPARLRHERTRCRDCAFDREDHTDNYGVYGARKIWHQLARQGHDDVARCTVERLTRINGLRGVARSKVPRMTVPAANGFPKDWVQRDFTATAPNTLGGVDT